MTLVVDASAVAAALVDEGPDGRWAEQALGAGPLVAPHLLLVETASILRRASLAKQLSDAVAALAHRELLMLPVELFPYDLVAERVWELRKTVSSYDAWYVALAELLDAPLATLDHRLSRASGPRCRFALPSRSS